ncbi:MAG TPA: hypothetical protein VM286_03965 [Candidatus Thermoplasmatota archaeon]|nr:hypothetical protein [Candidatus Thermoplasmatota archaeon]
MDPVQTYTVLGVLAVLLGVILYNAMSALRVRAKASAATGPAASWVGRHVQHHGDILGEVIAEEGDKVVVRKGTATLCLPRSFVRPQGLDLGVKGDLDMATALAEGQAWQVQRGAA